MHIFDLKFRNEKTYYLRAISNDFGNCVCKGGHHLIASQLAAKKPNFIYNILYYYHINVTIYYIVYIILLFFKTDKRTSKWFFMSTPWPVLSLLFLYTLIVLLGQRLMKTKEVFNVKRILIIYNALLVILSVYMLFEVGL